MIFCRTKKWQKVLQRIYCEINHQKEKKDGTDVRKLFHKTHFFLIRTFLFHENRFSSKNLLQILLKIFHKFCFPTCTNLGKMFVVKTNSLPVMSQPLASSKAGHEAYIDRLPDQEASSHIGSGAFTSYS